MGDRRCVGALFVAWVLAGCGGGHANAPARDPVLGRVDDSARRTRELFLRSEFERAEHAYGELIALCRQVDARYAKRCADVSKDIEDQKEEMWSMWARDTLHHPPGTRSSPAGASTEERRCRSELHNKELDASSRERCTAMIEANDEARREERAERMSAELTKLEGDLGVLTDETAIARRCASTRALRGKATEPEVKELQERVRRRCHAARLPLEQACEQRVRPLLESAKVDDALSVVRAEICSDHTYNDVARAVLARSTGQRERNAACTATTSLERLDATRLQRSASAERDRMLPELRRACHPVVAQRPPPGPPSYGSPYSQPPAMLQQQQPRYNSAPAPAPTRRADCGTFSASGQGSTMYQMNCR